MLAASLSSREKGHGSLRPGQILINDGLRQPNVVVALALTLVVGLTLIIIHCCNIYQLVTPFHIHLSHSKNKLSTSM